MKFLKNHLERIQELADDADSLAVLELFCLDKGQVPD